MATINTSQARYSTVAIVLHWLIAALIIANFVIAFVSEDFAKPERMAWMGNHKAIGIIVLALTVLRILWRLIHPTLPLEPGLKPWERTLARVTHALFYILLIVIPVAGWAMVSGRGGVVAHPLGIPVPALPVGDSKAVGDLAHEMHENLAFLMLALFVLHVAGAIKHQYFDRDGSMARMAPWMSR